jgi:hypothetical protein
VESSKRLSLVSGKIDLPIHGQTVLRTFDCAGRVAGLNGDGVYIWLAVEVEGLMWPKERNLKVGKDGTWSAKVFEDGSAPTFSLILIAADEVAHGKIEKWLALSKGGASGFEGMKPSEGIVRLDRIDGLLRLVDKQ